LAKEQHLTPLFLFLTAHNDSDSMSHAIDISIDAYIVKPVDIKILMQKIQSLLDKKYRDDNTHQFLNDILSDREYKVFLNIAKGVNPNTIASTYGIKPQTVSTYRQRILEKMNMNNNSDIIRYAIKHNLI
jgi:DNA-binding NarL/FixJ family response regulator